MKTQLAFKKDEPLFMRLERIASYSQLSPKQQMQYDDSFNNYLAVLGNEAYNKRVGFEQGMEQGIAEGAKQKSIAIARSMKADKMPLELIAKYSGLSIDEINEL